MKKDFKSFCYQQHFAFTLAEVLITLGIIGVVAAMTIPTLTRNIQNKQFQVAAKKALTDVNQAYKMMQATDTEFNEVVCSTLYAHCSSRVFSDNFKLLSKYFKAPKTCFEGTRNSQNKCWVCAKGEMGNWSAPPKYLGCLDGGTDPAFIDSSGRAWSMYFKGESIFLVDTNGFKGPNQIGKDRWAFELPDPKLSDTNKGMIIPMYSVNITTKNVWCPSGDCKYGTVFYNK